MKKITALLSIFFLATILWATENELMHIIDETTTLVHYTDGEGNTYLIDMSSTNPVVKASNTNTEFFKNFGNGLADDTEFIYVTPEGNQLKTKDGVNFIRQNEVDGGTYNKGGALQSAPVTNNEIVISPNPSDGKTNITFQREDDYPTDVIININTPNGLKVGQLYKGISTDSTFSLDFDTNRFYGGVYFLTIQVGDKLQVAKLRVAE